MRFDMAKAIKLAQGARTAVKTVEAILAAAEVREKVGEVAEKVGETKESISELWDAITGIHPDED